MKPRCLEDKFLGWSATGELLPCCWYDNPNKEYIKDLLDEKFRMNCIENRLAIRNFVQEANFFCNAKTEFQNSQCGSRFEGIVCVYI